MPDESAEVPIAQSEQAERKSNTLSWRNLAESFSKLSPEKMAARIDIGGRIKGLLDNPDTYDAAFKVLNSVVLAGALTGLIPPEYPQLMQAGAAMGGKKESNEASPQMTMASGVANLLGGDVIGNMAELVAGIPQGLVENAKDAIEYSKLKAQKGLDTLMPARDRLILENRDAAQNPDLYKAAEQFGIKLPQVAI